MSGPSPTMAHQSNDHVVPPISKIPDEILLDIFMLVVEDFPAEDPFFITHICRHWRAVAVGAPLLWVKPRTRKYECVKLMLERSDPADLHIVLESQMPTRTAQAIIDCMGRVGSLEIYAWEDDPSHTITPADAPVDFLDNNHVTQLMSLILRELWQRPRCLQALTIYNSSPNSDATPLLQRLQPMDKLRQLTLNSTAFEWSIFPLHSLAHLKVRCSNVSSPISIQELVEILGHMPLLESLSLEQPGRILSQPFTPSAIPSQSSKTTLPLLHYLRLQHNTIDIALYFLTHTVLPQLRRLAIGVEVDETFNDAAIFYHSNYTPLMRALTTTITTGNFGVFELLRLRDYSFDLETCSVDDDDASLPGIPDEGHLFVRSAICIRHGHRFWNETRIDGQVFGAKLLEDLIGLICTPSLARIAYIQIDDDISVVNFQQLLKTQCCSSLDHLVIHDPGQYMPALTLLLAVTLPQNIEDAPLIPFLELGRICFYFGRLKDVPPAVWNAFCDCLRMRKSVGNPLEEIFVDECSITSEQISSLENVVTTVITQFPDLYS